MGRHDANTQTGTDKFSAGGNHRDQKERGRGRGSPSTKRGTAETCHAQLMGRPQWDLCTHTHTNTTYVRPASSRCQVSPRRPMFANNHLTPSASYAPQALQTPQKSKGILNGGLSSVSRKLFVRTRRYKSLVPMISHVISTHTHTHDSEYCHRCISDIAYEPTDLGAIFFLSFGVEQRSTTKQTTFMVLALLEQNGPHRTNGGLQSELSVYCFHDTLFFRWHMGVGNFGIIAVSL